LQTECIKAAETTRIPKRFVYTASAYNIFTGYTGRFSVIADVLLVPISFKQEAYFDLYDSRQYYVPLLRDNIIFLRRITLDGIYTGRKAKVCDIPENVRNRAGYRLVVTCAYLEGFPGKSDACVGLVLEMEF
jgi:hypothetical protein